MKKSMPWKKSLLPQKSRRELSKKTLIDVKTNYPPLKNWSRVFLDKTSVGVKMWSSWRTMCEVSSVMYFLPVSLFPILEPSLLNLDLNSGEIFGCLILSTSRSPALKELSLWKFLQASPSKLDGKMRDYPPITCHSKMHQSFVHAQDGHFWSTHSFKVPAGLEDLKETTSLRSTSTKNIGWEN